MPKLQPEPWFHKRDQIWKVTVRGKQIKLCADREEAWRLYHAMMAESKTQPPVSPASMTMLELATAFLEWAERERGRFTFAEFQRYLKSFIKSIHPTKRVADLIKHDITKWLEGMPSLKSGGQRAAIQCVKRCLNWGVEEGLIQSNPLAAVRKPKKGRREVFFTQEQFANVLSLCTDDEFRELLTVAIETGARPEELRDVEARHIRGSRIVFSVDENKTGERTDEHRVIYLTEKALLIIQRLCKIHRSGPLFRNRQGGKWTRDSIKNRFLRMRKRNSHPKRGANLDLPQGMCMYAIRHTYATEALENGVHPEELRVLMGHSDLDMIVRHYSHLAEKKTHIEKAAERARSNRTA